MKRWMLAGAVAVAWVVAVCGPRAEAQFGYQRPQVTPFGNRPAVSPYLNLLRGGTNPAVNYYALVRPQQDTAQSLQQLQQQYAQVQTQGLMNPDDPNRVLSITGHGAQFMNYGSYFPLATGGRAGQAQSPLGSIRR